MELGFTQLLNPPWAGRRKHTLVKHGDHLVLLGGFSLKNMITPMNLNDIWRTLDGETWEKLTDSAPWDGRDGHSSLTHRGQIYVMGGTSNVMFNYNDVWCSPNGQSWTRICREASWCGRWMQAAVEHNGALYIMGGWSEEGEMLNDVWKSEDGGIKWVQMTSDAQWCPRMFHVGCSFGSYIYILGGKSQDCDLLNDVWASRDGQTWHLVTKCSDWCPREGHAVHVYMDKLFVMGGEGEGSNYLNDTWSSTDGNKWFQEGVKNEDDDGITSWCPRKGHAVAVLNEKLYIMGGVTIQSMIKYCDNDERIPENDGGGCEEAASEATSEVQQSTTTSCSLSPSFLPNSELSQVYLCDCVVLSYKSKYNCTSSALPLLPIPENRKVSPPELSATASTRTKLDMCYDGNDSWFSTAIGQLVEFKKADKGMLAELQTIQDTIWDVVDTVKEALGDLRSQTQNFESSVVVLEGGDRLKKLKVAECTGDDETNSDGDFRSIQKPTKGSPNPTKGHSRLDTDYFPLFHPACQFSPHFELQRNLKDVAKAKQSFIMTQQKLLREAMLNSGAERQQSKLQRIPRKYHTHDAKDLNFPDGQDCIYIYMTTYPSHSSTIDDLEELRLVQATELLKSASYVKNELEIEATSSTAKLKSLSNSIDLLAEQITLLNLGDSNMLAGSTDNLNMGCCSSSSKDCSKHSEPTETDSDKSRGNCNSCGISGDIKVAFQNLEERARSLFATITAESSLAMLPDILHMRDNALSHLWAVGNNMEALATRLQNAASVVVSLNPTSKTIRCNDDQGNNDDSIEDEKNRNTKCIAGTLESLISLPNTWEDLVVSLKDFMAHAPGILSTRNDALSSAKELRKSLILTGFELLSYHMKCLEGVVQGFKLEVESATQIVKFCETVSDLEGLQIIRETMVHKLSVAQLEELDLEDALTDARSKLKKRLRRKAEESELSEIYLEIKDTATKLRDIRDRRRSLIIDAASLAQSTIPELAMDVPVILDPAYEIEPSGLPRRCLDDYTLVKTIEAKTFHQQHYLDGNLTGNVDCVECEQPPPPVSGISSCMTQQDSRVFVATLDDEVVVLKRKSLEQELSILTRVKHDCVISATAIVREVSMPTMYIELPYAAGGDLSFSGIGFVSNLENPGNFKEHSGRLCEVLNIFTGGSSDLKEDMNFLLQVHEKQWEIEDTNSTICEGTNSFTAPEVGKGVPSTFSSDCFSLGCVLYCLHSKCHMPEGSIAGLNYFSFGDKLDVEYSNEDVELHDLLIKLLSIDVTQRPGTTDILLHPYLQSTYIPRLEEKGQLMNHNARLNAAKAFFQSIRDEMSGGANAISHRAAPSLHWHLSSRTPSIFVPEILAMLEELRIGWNFLRPLWVSFEGEAGVDEGGLLNETSSSGEGRDESNGTPTGVLGCPRYLPTARVSYSENDLKRYFLIGIAFVKCLLEGRRIGNSFCPSLFKFITGSAVSLLDMVAWDSYQATSLQANDKNNKEENRSFLVNDANKFDYVKERVQHILVDSRKGALQALSDGVVSALNSVSPETAPFLSLLRHTDWQILLCGQTYVSGSQIVAILSWSGFSAKSKIPTWLQDLLMIFKEDTLRKFLTFVSGCSSLPAAAIGTMKITVRRQPQSLALPVAHTCFNQLDIPEYDTKEELHNKLLQALTLTTTFDLL